MPATSKAQQRFMGMVHSAQQGERPASAAVAKVAKDIKPSDAKDFASTKHKGLPAKKEGTAVARLREYIKKVVKETLTTEKQMEEAGSRRTGPIRTTKAQDRSQARRVSSMKKKLDKLPKSKDPRR